MSDKWCGCFFIWLLDNTNEVIKINAWKILPKISANVSISSWTLVKTNKLPVCKDLKHRFRELQSAFVIILFMRASMPLFLERPLLQRTMLSGKWSKPEWKEGWLHVSFCLTKASSKDAGGKFWDDPWAATVTQLTQKHRNPTICKNPWTTDLGIPPPPHSRLMMSRRRRGLQSHPDGQVWSHQWTSSQRSMWEFTSSGLRIARGRTYTPPQGDSLHPVLPPPHSGIKSSFCWRNYIKVTCTCQGYCLTLRSSCFNFYRIYISILHFFLLALTGS